MGSDSGIAISHYTYLAVILTYSKAHRITRYGPVKDVETLSPQR